MTESVRLALALAIATFLPPGTLAACPTGSFQGPDQQSCFTVHTEPKTWDWADSECSRSGGGLASIWSAFENFFLRKIASTDLEGGHFWTGGKYDLIANEWYWNDDSNWSYENWAKRQPGNTNSGDCLSFSAENGNWYNEKCATKKPFICRMMDRNATNSDKCPKGWTYIPSSYRCIQASLYRDSSYNWYEARMQCTSAGSDLVSIPNDATNAAIFSYLMESPVHMNHEQTAIGLTYNSTTKVWTWPDGSSAAFTAWGKGYPRPKHVSDFGDPNFGYMSLAGSEASTWSNGEAQVVTGVLCERPSKA